MRNPLKNFSGHRFRVHVWALATCMFLTGVGNAAAQSAVSRFGASDARRCYEAATSKTGQDIDPCDKALREVDMTLRDRRATLVNRGIIYNRLGRFDDAIADFDAALEGDPNLGEALLNRGNSRYLQREFEAAIEDYRAALASDFGRPAVIWYNIGLARKASGDLPAARNAFIQATASDPGFAPAREQLAALNVAAQEEADDAATSSEE
ncbi:MAG: tetratricopeptide repeat protein [Pseudomonadota bacterium]